MIQLSKPAYKAQILFTRVWTIWNKQILVLAYSPKINVLLSLDTHVLKNYFLIIITCGFIYEPVG